MTHTFYKVLDVYATVRHKLYIPIQAAIGATDETLLDLAIAEDVENGTNVLEGFYGNAFPDFHSITSTIETLGDGERIPEWDYLYKGNDNG